MSDPLRWMQSIEQAEVSYPRVVEELRKMGGTDEEILKIAQVLESTCHECWRADLTDGDCYCWDDE